MYWPARVPDGTPISKIHSLILCSICRFGPSFGESFHSFKMEGNKKVGYFPVFLFISSLNRKIGCDHFKFLNPFSGQQKSSGSADVLDVLIVPLITPFEILNLRFLGCPTILMMRGPLLIGHCRRF